MALSASTVWEVRSTGSDTLNGGGFVTGASGTDWSQQNAAQVAFDGTVIAAHTAGVTNVIILSGYTPQNSDVGNIWQCTGGTGFIAGFYQITAISIGGLTWTLDRNATSGVASGATGGMGGALATPTTAINTAMVGQNKVYIKNATYVTTVALTMPSGVAGKYTVAEGYNTARGDLVAVNNFANFPLIQANNTSQFLIDNNTTSYTWVRCLVVDGGSGASASQLGLRNGNYGVVENCKAMRWKVNQGFNIMTGGVIVRCLATQGASGSDAGYALFDRCIAIDCVSTANGCEGFRIGQGGTCINCISYANTGATGHGYQFETISGATGFMMGCVAYGNAGDGVKISGAVTAGAPAVVNTAITGNSGYGINSDTTVFSQFAGYNNAFFNNTSGTYHNVPAGLNDVTLTADPFTAAGSGNFAPNGTAGGGAALKAAGIPGVLPLALTTGYEDIGIQHQDAGSTIAVQVTNVAVIDGPTRVMGY
jgi:hypothetical protein